MAESKKVGFFDLKKNLKGILVIAIIITISGWYFGFNWSDVNDFAHSIATSHRPELPVSVSYRKSLMGKGYVAIINNNSNNDINVSVNLRDNNSTNKKNQTIKIGHNQKIQIGWMEGWQFALGDVVRLSNPDYREGVYIIQ